MGTFFEDTMTGLLQAISIEKGNIQVEKITNMPADTYRVAKEEVNNPKFPALSSEVKRLKETEGGVSAVCEVMEYYNKEAVKAERIEKIQAMLKQNCSEEFILSIGYTKEDYLEAQKLLLCPV